MELEYLKKNPESETALPTPSNPIDELKTTQSAIKREEKSSKAEEIPLEHIPPLLNTPRVRSR
jgi:hypothetical protein